MSGKTIVGILLHVVFVLIIMVVVLYIMPMKHQEPTQPFDFIMLIFTLLQVSAFYFTAYILHPRLLSRKKVAAFILVICSLSIAIALVPALSSYLLSGHSLSRTLAKMLVLFIIGLFVMGTATSYRFIIDAFREQQIRQNNLVSELSFLRSQVSPHFMFNTLNSLVALARKQSDKLEPALMKMSGLMHYMLYDSDEEKVSLDKEISYIQSYIDLQTMRFGNTVPILFSVNQQGHCHSIEPMLLIPIGTNKQKVFTVDLKVASSGGRYFTPVDLEASIARNTEVLNENMYNAERLPSYFRTDLRFGFRLNNVKRKLTHTFYLDLQNVTANDNIFTRRYNQMMKTVGDVNQIGFFPDILYRLQF